VFRIVGHYFSLRGARRALTVVTWTVKSSLPLSQLRPLVAEDPDARAERVREIAEALDLEHLASFFQRTATP